MNIPLEMNVSQTACYLLFLFERVELIKLENLEGGEGVAHYPNTPQYTGVLLCNCNLYKYF